MHDSATFSVTDLVYEKFHFQGIFLSVYTEFEGNRVQQKKQVSQLSFMESEMGIE